MNIEQEFYIDGMRRGFEKMVAAFDSYIVVMRNAADAIAKFFNIISNEEMIKHVAIRYYDIPESDIRRVEGDTVVLWNHRRIQIDLAYRGKFNYGE